MDMNWPAIGAVGEILGAIAVVATLFYLTRQIRQSTRMARANLSKDLFLTSQTLIYEVGANPDVAKIMADFRGFEDVEGFRLSMLLQSHFRLYELAFTLHNDGLIDDGIYESYLAVVRMFTATKGFDAYWEPRRPEFHAAFRAYVDEQRALVKRENDVD